MSVTSARSVKDVESRARSRKTHEPEPFLRFDIVKSPKDTRQFISQNTVSRCDNLQTPIAPSRLPRQPNMHIKRPFKQARDDTDLISTNINVPEPAYADPAAELLDRSTNAIYHLQQVCATQPVVRQPVQQSGKLIRGKLYPINRPVKITGPSINQCRGIVSEKRNPYGESRTIKRRGLIMANIDEVRDIADEGYLGVGGSVGRDLRPSTGESLHRTSVASSTTDEENLAERLRSLEDVEHFPDALQEEEMIKSIEQVVMEGRNKLHLQYSTSGSSAGPEIVAEMNITRSRKVSNEEKVAAAMGCRAQNGVMMRRDDYDDDEDYYRDGNGGHRSSPTRNDHDKTSNQRQNPSHTTDTPGGSSDTRSGKKTCQEAWTERGTMFSKLDDELNEVIEALRTVPGAASGTDEDDSDEEEVEDSEKSSNRAEFSETIYQQTGFRENVDLLEENILQVVESLNKGLNEKVEVQDVQGGGASQSFLETLCDGLQDTKLQEEESRQNNRQPVTSTKQTLSISPRVCRLFPRSDVPVSSQITLPPARPPFSFRPNCRPPHGRLFYFAYGDFVSCSRLRHLLRALADPDPQPTYWGLLMGFGLKFNKSSDTTRDATMSSIHFANVEPDVGQSVEGRVYLLTREQLSKLDSLLRYPEHYYRLAAPVWLCNAAHNDGNDATTSSVSANDLAVAQWCVPAVFYVAQDKFIAAESHCTPSRMDYSASQCLRAGRVDNLFTDNYQMHLKTHYLGITSEC